MRAPETWGEAMRIEVYPWQDGPWVVARDGEICSPPLSLRAARDLAWCMRTNRETEEN